MLSNIECEGCHVNIEYDDDDVIEEISTDFYSNEESMEYIVFCEHCGYPNDVIFEV